MKRPFALLFFVLLCLPDQAFAQRALQKQLKRGVHCFEQLNYGCAISALEKAARLAKKAPGSLAPATALLLYKTQGFALAAVGRHGKATLAFERCFAVDPSFYLDSKVVSPKIYADFQEARRRSLLSKLKGKIRAPELPQVFDPPPPKRLFLHSPPQFQQGAWLTEDQQNRVHIMVGGHFLFGDDADSFGAGFGVQLNYGFKLNRFFDAVAGLSFFRHEYSGNDLKSGFTGALLIVQPSLGVRAHLLVAEIWDVGVGFHLGASAMGVGNLSDRVGGLGALSAFVHVTPHPSVAVGLNVSPTLVLATLRNEQLGSSLSLPVFASIQMRF
jgi:hypothetical protein